MRFLPEYGPARKLALAFVDAFFNTRFHYGRTQAEIIRACGDFPVEMHVAPGEMDAFTRSAGEEVLTRQNLTINPVAPPRAILLEAVPIFAEEENGQRVGLIFHNPRLDTDAQLYEFACWLAEQNGFKPVEVGFNFATAQLLVNEDLVLLSAAQFQSHEDQQKLEYLREHFPDYHYHVVPPLYGELTDDLDMYLWPIAPKTWIVSQYPAGSPQEQSVTPALDVLKHYGHTIHRVPGLEPIIYDDVNSMPNYANGVILNRLALVPAYNRPEDRAVVDILKGYGFSVHQIGCSDIILSNSGIHCISRVIPA